MFAIVASLALAISAGVSRNFMGAAFFGLVTLALIWLAVRPERDSTATTFPLRGMTLGATGATAVSVLFVIAAVGETQDPKGRGLLVLASLSAVALALLLWGIALVMWRRGWRWTSATTWGELHAARATGQRLEAPEKRAGR